MCTQAAQAPADSSTPLPPPPVATDLVLSALQSDFATTKQTAALVLWFWLQPPGADAPPRAPVATPEGVPAVLTTLLCAPLACQPLLPASPAQYGEAKGYMEQLRR